MNAFDTLTLLVVCLYFTAYKDWLPLYLSLSVLGAVSYLVLMVFVPESPKWLLLKGRQEEAISAFNKIAAINRTPNRIPLDAIFVES